MRVPTRIWGTSCLLLWVWSVCACTVDALCHPQCAHLLLSFRSDRQFGGWSPCKPWAAALGSLRKYTRQQEEVHIPHHCCAVRPVSSTRAIWCGAGHVAPSGHLDSLLCISMFAVGAKGRARVSGLQYAQMEQLHLFHLLQQHRACSVGNSFKQLSAVFNNLVAWRQCGYLSRAHHCTWPLSHIPRTHG